MSSRQHTKDFQDALLLSYFPNPKFVERTDHQRLNHESGDVALVRWLWDMAGVSGANLSTSHIANDYLFSSPSFFLLDSLTALYESNPELFQGLTMASQDMFTGRNAWLKLDCDELKAKSLAENASAFQAGPWRPFHRIQKERPVISRCAKCHTEGFSPDAPAIPFEDSLRLALRVRSSKDGLGEKILERIEAKGRHQMPPGNPLSIDEIEAMKEFIHALK
ncbi:MAG: hypothetical protein HC883_02415 [Bdellovibrionaceae bacterium]|nr:hypothetical protein [Pseudobdellovibrionaceae bacterium]